MSESSSTDTSRGKRSEFAYKPPLYVAGGPLQFGLRLFPLLWCAFLILSPFYLFSSGIPQVGDYAIALLIVILFTGYSVRVPIFNDLYLSGAMFLGYIALVNWWWFAFYREALFVLAPLYYLFNFCVLIFVVSILHKFGAEMIVMTRLGLALAIGMEVAICLLGPGGGWREIGTFNNPNQLSYWSLLCLACWLVLKREERLSGRDMVIMCGVLYLVVLALSKAALIACVILIFLGVIVQGLKPKMGWGLGGLIALLLMLLSAESALLERLVSDGPIANVIERIDDIGKQEDDTAAHRGYDRLWLYPQYLILGAGEGGFQRFPQSEALDEIHSTFGTILFSYGVVGSILFVLFLYRVFRNAPIRHFVYFFPICLYGLTHQGLRFTLLWVFFGFVFGLGNVRAVVKGDARREL